jgi:tetratricopeptide (TPR) repeat protein
MDQKSKKRLDAPEPTPEFTLSKLTLAIVLFLFVIGAAVGAADKQSDRETLLMERADICELAGRFEEAARLYTQVLSIDSWNCDALNKRGMVEYILGQYDRAQGDVNRSVELCPDARSYFLRAEILIAQGKPESAIADLDRSFRMTESTSAIRCRAVANMLCGHFQQSRTDAYRHLTRMPKSTLSLEISSVSDALCGLPSASISRLGEFCTNRLHQDPHTQLSEIKRKSIKTAVGFPQGAMTDVEREKLIDLLQKNHAGLSQSQLGFATAIIYFYQRNYERALAELSRSASSRMPLYNDLLACYCLILSRDFPSARNKLSSLTALSPDSLAVLDAVDLYHYEADSRQKCIEEIISLLVKNPKNAAALIELAKIYHDLSQLPTAIKYCDLALQVEPTNINVMLLKANLLTSQESYESALKVLAAVQALDRQNPAMFFARASIYTREKRWSDAIVDLSKAIQSRYDLSRSLRARAACHGALKEYALQREDLNVASKDLIN